MSLQSWLQQREQSADIRGEPVMDIRRKGRIVLDRQGTALATCRDEATAAVVAELLNRTEALRRGA